MDIPQYKAFEDHICKVWGGQLSNGKYWIQIILHEENGQQLVIESIQPNFHFCVCEGLIGLNNMYPERIMDNIGVQACLRCIAEELC